MENIMDHDLIEKLRVLANQLDDASGDISNLISSDNLPTADSYIAGAQGHANQACQALWDAIFALQQGSI